jgi:hypothetical protein
MLEIEWKNGQENSGSNKVKFGKGKCTLQMVLILDNCCIVAYVCFVLNKEYFSCCKHCHRFVLAQNLEMSV